MYSFPNLEPVCCSISSSNCCFLTCIQVSQEAGQVVWYSYLLKNFPQFIVIHTVKSFGIVSKADIDAFCKSCFFHDPADIGNLISGSSALSCACTVVFSATDPASGHHWPTPLLETPGHSQASLGPSLVGSVLLSPGSWCSQCFLCTLQECFPCLV